MKHRISVFVACLFLMLAVAAWPTPAFAEDFTFNVPVKLTNVPAEYNDSIIVIVQVYDPTGMIARYLSPPIHLQNGQFSGTIVCKFNVIPGKNKQAASSYNVQLYDSKSRGLPAYDQTTSVYIINAQLPKN